MKRLVICLFVIEVLVLSALALTTQARTAGEKAGDLPYGLWFGEAPRESTERRIEVIRDGGGFAARIDGDAARVALTSGRLTLSGNNGDQFRGALADNERSITGHWIQPETNTGYSRMATRVTLHRTTTNRWEANVQVQDRPFRIFLEIFESEGEGESEGDYAVIRNPERNDILRATRFQADALDTGRIKLTAGSGDRAISHWLKRDGDSLVLDHNRFSTPLRLTRATREQSLAYYPRPPGERHRYQMPSPADDGWRVQHARDAGFDVRKLDELLTVLAESDPRSRRPQLIHSMLVARKGRLVFEEYFYGFDRDTRHDIRSLGKVFSPLLVGALREAGAAIAAKDAPVPEILAKAGLDAGNSKKSAITLEHLMTHTSGLDCDENPSSAGEEDRLWQEGTTLGFWAYTAALPLLHDPGTHYAYCSAGINMSGYAIRQSAGVPILDAIHMLLADPLQFTDYHWNLMPDREAYLGGGAYLRPRDILKLGQIQLSGGEWNGTKVLSRDWIAASTQPRIDISPETTGLTSEEFANNYFPGKQAYAWRVNDIAVGDTVYSSFEATGNGGQIVLVIPDLDMSVVFTGGNYFMGYIWGRWRDEIVGRYLIPAIDQSTP
ncbi:MAG: serine hydrolase domain-containing protein [Pseudomonadota bacterium]